MDQHIFIDFDKKIEIDTNGLTKLHFLINGHVNFEEEQDNFDKDTRLKLQFAANLNSKDSNMIGFGRLGSSKRSSNKSHDFKLTKFMRHFIGAIIDHNKTYFCTPQNCSYSVLLELSDISSLIASNSILKKLTDLKTSNEITQDYIHNQGSRVYTFTPKNSEDFMINLYPIEGEVKLYASISSIPQNLEQSLWKLEDPLSKRLIITAKERQNLLIDSDKKFYITVKADKTSSYLIKVKQYFYGNGNLDLGFVESGNLLPGEFKTHYLILENSQPTLSEFGVKLHLWNGLGDLYQKACGNLIEEECVFNKDDYDGNKLEDAKFKKIEGDGSQKEITYPVYCTNDNPKAILQTDQIESLKTYKTVVDSHGIYKSPSCTFLIGIHAQEDKQDGRQAKMIQYEISADEENEDHIQNEDHNLKLRLLPEQFKYYKFHLQHSSQSLEKIRVSFDTFYGLHEICIFKGEQRPQDFKQCFLRKAYNGVNQGLYSNYEIFEIDKANAPDGVLEGTYYIAIHGLSYSSISLVLNTVKKGEGQIENHGVDSGKNDSKTNGNFYKWLKAGSYMSDKLVDKNDSRNFGFKVDFGDDQDSLFYQDSISISLAPIVGKFVFAVRNDGAEPSLDQKNWVSDENHLVITKDDPNFKNNTVYKVKVWPLIENVGKSRSFKISKKPSPKIARSKSSAVVIDESQIPKPSRPPKIPNKKSSVNKKSSYTNYQFQIQYSHVGRSIVLTPGRQEIGTQQDSEQCFLAEISPGVKDIQIVKGLTNSELYMYATLGGGQKVALETRQKIADHHTSAISYSSIEIESKCKSSFIVGQVCDQNLCLEGAKHSRYSISFTHDDKPFMLQQNEVFNGPLIVDSQKKQNFLYTIDKKDQFLDLEEYSAVGYIKMKAKLVEGKNIDALGFDFPSFDSKNQGEKPHESTAKTDKNKDNRQKEESTKKSSSLTSNVIHFTQQELNEFYNPLLQVSLARKGYGERFHDSYKNKIYNPNFNFSLQVSSGLTYLEKGKDKIDTVQNGHWKYYTFYNDSKYNKDKQLVIDVEPQDNGDPDLYLIKGKYKRPSFRNSLISSSEFGGDHIILNYKHLRKVGLEKFEGYYVIGIYGATETKFILKWNYFNSKINQTSFNSPSFYNLKSGKNQYIEQHNSMPKTPIELRITSNRAKVFMYVKTYKGNQGYLEQYPTEKDYYWGVILEPHQNSKILKINTHDKHYCDDCRYLVMLKTENIGARVEFLGLIKSALSFVDQHNGVTFEDELHKSEQKKFRIEFPPDRKNWPDVDINLQNGEVKVLVNDSIFFDSSTNMKTLEIGKGRNFVKLIGGVQPQQNIITNKDKAIDDINTQLPSREYLMADPSNFFSGYYPIDYLNDLQNNEQFLRVECQTENCLYKIQSRVFNGPVLMKSGKRNQGTIGSGEKQKFQYKADGNEKKIEVIFTAIDVVKGIPLKDLMKQTNPLHNSEVSDKGSDKVKPEKQEEDVTDSDKHKLLNSALDNLEIYYTSDKSLINTDIGTHNKDFMPLQETRNNDAIVKTYQAMKGYYIIEINNILKENIHYSLEVVTNQYRVIQVGDYVTDYVTYENPSNYYEVYVEKPGFIYLDFKKCLSNVEFYYKKNDLSKNFKQQKGNSDFGSMVEVEHAGSLFFEVKKTKFKLSKLEEKYGHTSSKSVYSFEFYYKENYENYPFKGVRAGSNGEIDQQIGSSTKVSLNPVDIDNQLLDKFDYRIAYHLIMSQSEIEVNFKGGCDDLFSDLIPEEQKGNLIEEVYQGGTKTLGFHNTPLNSEQTSKQKNVLKFKGSQNKRRILAQNQKVVKELPQPYLTRDSDFDIDLLIDKDYEIFDGKSAKKAAKKKEPIHGSEKYLNKKISSKKTKLMKNLMDIVQKFQHPKKDVKNQNLTENSKKTKHDSIQHKWIPTITFSSDCCTFNPILDKNTVYYGKVYVSLWATEKSASSKHKKPFYTKIYYDDFVLKSPRYMIHFEYIFISLGTLTIILALLLISRFSLKKIINRLKGFRKISNVEEKSADEQLDDLFAKSQVLYEAKLAQDWINKNTAKYQKKMDGNKAKEMKSQTEEQISAIDDQQTRYSENSDRFAEIELSKVVCTPINDKKAKNNADSGQKDDDNDDDDIEKTPGSEKDIEITELGYLN